MQRKVERAIKDLREAERVMSKTGTVAAEPMPVNILDGFVIVKPKKEWSEPSMTREYLAARIENAICRLVLKRGPIASAALEAKITAPPQHPEW